MKQSTGPTPKQFNQKFWGKNLDISVLKSSLNVCNGQPGLSITNLVQPHLADEETEDFGNYYYFF